MQMIANAVPSPISGVIMTRDDGIRCLTLRDPMVIWRGCVSSNYNGNQRKPLLP